MKLRTFNLREHLFYYSQRIHKKSKIEISLSPLTLGSITISQFFAKKLNFVQVYRSLALSAIEFFLCRLAEDY
jgi:hypothetical protein